MIHATQTILINTANKTHRAVRAISHKTRKIRKNLAKAKAISRKNLAKARASNKSLGRIKIMNMPEKIINLTNLMFMMRTSNY